MCVFLLSFVARMFKVMSLENTLNDLIDIFYILFFNEMDGVSTSFDFLYFKHAEPSDLWNVSSVSL